MTSEHHPSPLEVTERRDVHGGYELHLVGEVDLSSLPVLTAQVQRILGESPSRIGFELSGVSFMDSSGIGVLLDVARVVPDVALVNPSRAVQRLIELCGLTSILPMSLRGTAAEATR